MALIPAAGRQKQGYVSEFKASLVYQRSSRTARDTQRNPVSTNKKEERQKVSDIEKERKGEGKKERKRNGGKRDGSLANSTGSSYRGPIFSSQHLYGDSTHLQFHFQGIHYPLLASVNIRLACVTQS